MVEMAPNAVTIGHCQIQLRPVGAVALFSVDRGQNPDWRCESEAHEFYNTQK